MEVRAPLSLGETTSADSAPCDPIIFLQWRAAARLSRQPPYRWICEVFQCGLIDRTQTLDLGFDAGIIDPLRTVLERPTGHLDFDELCQARAEEIVNEAIGADRRIQVLWSGGIDSTVALIALMGAAREMDASERLQVLCSVESVTEYQRFFHQHVWKQWEICAVGYPLSQYLSADAIVVTGEHGDQLFGSDFLQPYVANGLAFLPWHEGLPFALAGNGLSAEQADAVTEYLRPLMDACPVDVDTLFDFFWWLNFSCKWQSVTLRIPANTDQPRSAFESIRHFFRTDGFQRWSVFQHPRESLESWREYKMPAKRYIHAYTGDEEYLIEKEKQRSLRLVIAGEPQYNPPPPPDRKPEHPPDWHKQEPLDDVLATHHLALASDFTHLWINSA